ncbi:60S ribosomal protein L1, mitochondrial precursor [Microdochium trichocladiopsis]|uniref:60S ribosomal protein L1, mitochondrial n=1 Tax=Microdochium trichocladiopsis TaxID=1682393 RepID=A0A9P9BQ15_9PEZI|nr:60S ribosomal protein L1, mitochondrial precursor [Microdochium trichocladiopsis]KAH7033684.1 60S ribosomal protein L1, mitochondrial precursor [Microdochium trichocladiopsis]
MASAKHCTASLARLAISAPCTARPAISGTIVTASRSAAALFSTTQTVGKAVSKKTGPTLQQLALQKERAKRKKKQSRHKEYKYATPSEEERWSLCDAMRYLRAAEVGRPPESATYEVSLKIRTNKNGPVIRNRIRLPYPVKNDTRVAVICKEGSGAMSDARNAGAVAFGEESLYELIRTKPNDLPFNRLICHADCEASLKKAGLGRILGPKGMMPSLKTNTITRSVAAMMREMVGAEAYREKVGAIRMPIGNIQFTPKQLSENVKTLVAQIKDDIVKVEDRTGQKKDLIEVVLSSTKGPGFSLSGGFLPTDENVDAAALSTAM